MPKQYRYALVGTGARAQLYIGAIAGQYAGAARLCAWADTNPGRLAWSERAFLAGGVATPERFPVSELAEAVLRHRVDRVIVTSPDWTHADYIIHALGSGADVIVEKPLTTSETSVGDIARALATSDRELRVTFNYRYSPRNWALKRVLAAGEIGDVTSVHFEWLLDTVHGADYFRRWHRDKRNSGGLLVHKASHHFDLVNWWLGDVPTRVFASGGLRFYGARNARRRGLEQRPSRGTTDSALRDAYCLDLRDDPTLKGLYLDQEHYDGYMRDRDVFGDGITIEDNLALVVDYRRGASLSYALNAHSPWEGYTVSVNGTRGRAELRVVERAAVVPDARGHVLLHDPGVDNGVRAVAEQLVVQRHFDTARELPIVAGMGAHGGGDERMLEDIFGAAGDGQLEGVATFADGVRALAVGLAANRSLTAGQAVNIEDLELGVDL